MGLYGLMKDYKIFIFDLLSDENYTCFWIFPINQACKFDPWMQKSKNNSFLLQIAENLCPKLVYNFKWNS